MKPNKPLKILQLGKFYPPDMGGIERTMSDIVEGMNERGEICDVLCSNSKAKFSLDITPSHSRIYRTKSYGLLARTSITPQMIYFLRAFLSGYDIIHVHLPDPMANLALRLSNLKDKIIILHWHSDIIKQKHLLKLYKPLLSWLLERADSIIATSPNYVRESEFLKLYPNKCAIIPSGINPHSALESPTQKDTKLLFALGRFVEYKGFEYAIRALKFLPKEYCLLLGGSGPMENELKKLVKELGLEKRVEFLGFIADEELPRFYEKVGVFVLSSITKNEAFGLVQIEAMAHSVPVVSCEIKGSGVSFVNENGVSGFVVPPKNPQAIAQAVLTISQNYDFYATNARARFVKHFTKDKMLDSLQGLYYELAKAKIAKEGGGQYEVIKHFSTHTTLTTTQGLAYAA